MISLDQKFERLCSVCKAPDPGPVYRRAASTLVAVRGAEKYEICCCCGRRIPEAERTAGYKRQFKRFARRRSAQRAWDHEQERIERARQEAVDAENARAEYELVYGKGRL